MTDFNQEFIQLEEQIEALLKRYQEANNENNILRKKLSDFLQEKSGWQENHSAIASKLKNLITQIKEELE